MQRPKLEAWWTQMCKDPIPARIKEEVEGGLQGWEDKNRWDELGITEQVADVNYMWRP